MKYRVAELGEEFLDQAVAKAAGFLYDKAVDREVTFAPGSPSPMRFYSVCMAVVDGRIRRFAPSTDWADGGPIIERERIVLHPVRDGEAQWWSLAPGQAGRLVLVGSTPLIAAMRAYVAAKLGEEVELP